MALDFTAITALPDAPQKSDPSNFASEADTFVAALETFEDELNTTITELNKITSGLDTLSTIAEWSAVTTYDFPDVVAGSDGHTYRCIDTSVLNEDPTTDTTETYWLRLSVSNTVFQNKFKATNLLINGGFDFWGRSSSQVLSGYYSDDRWTNQNVTSSKTHSRQTFTVGQTDVPGNPRYYSRTVITTGGTTGSYTRKAQRIENVWTAAGQTVTLAFSAKADASRSIATEFVQDFGSGGSSDVDQIGVQKHSLTTSWQEFTDTVSISSITGKTVGTSSFLELRFWFEAGSTYNSNTDTLGTQSGTFEIANVRILYGNDPDPVFVKRHPQDERALCERYYVNWGTVRFTAAKDSAAAQNVALAFPTTMREMPSVGYDSLGDTDASGLSINSFTSTSNMIYLVTFDGAAPTGGARFSLNSAELDAEL